jgi:peptide/nickel transport system substrate-binding protein
MQRRMFLSAFAAVAAVSATLFLPQAASAVEKPGKDTLVVATMWECLPMSMKARRSRFFNESEILDTLIKLDYDMKLIPGLATSWQRTSDTEWTFDLREGVRFHDGTNLDASAVKYSLERVIDILPYAKGLLDIAEISAIGANQVNIRTNQPFAALANQLTDAITGIYARASFDAEGKNLVKPIGTGPFQFVSYAKQDRTVVERFDGYWGAAPALKRVVYRYIPDHSSRVLALETGEVDLAVNIPPADVRRLNDAPEYKVHREPAAGLYYMVLNTTESSPFADVRVRQAVNALVDRESLVTYGLDGVGIPAWEFFSPGFDWVPAGTPAYSLDPKKAEALIGEAGYSKENGRWTKDGQPLTVKMLSYSTRTEMPIILESVKGMLNAAGIEVETKLFTWPGMLSLVKKGEYDGYAVFWTPEMTAHPDMHLKAHFHSSQAMMFNGYRNAELDDLLIKGRGLDAGTERQMTYGKALTIIQDEAPVMPLVHKVYVAASNATVKGYRVHPSGFFYNFKVVRKD